MQRLLALLVDEDGTVLVRHDCPWRPCPHTHLGHLQSAGTWVDFQGRPAPSGRYEVLAPPPGGIVLTSYASTGRVFAGRSGALSLKWAVQGRETYEMDRGLRAVAGGSCLVVNEGRDYVSTIEPGEPAETFCLSVGRRFATGVARALEEPVGPLLDDPHREGGTPVEMLEGVTAGGSDLLAPLSELRRRMAELEGPALQELAMATLARLLEGQQRTVARAEGLEGLRRSDRLEVYRRLLRARDYIEATLAADEGLDRWAAVADMSRFHFVRSFRQAFGSTPHQFLIARRLERARELLEGSGRSATDIALELGFDSPSHFAAAFRRRYGSTPTQARRAAVAC